MIHLRFSIFFSFNFYIANEITLLKLWLFVVKSKPQKNSDNFKCEFIWKLKESKTESHLSWESKERSHTQQQQTDAIYA